MRGILRGFGLKMGVITRKGFEARVRELSAGQAMLERITRAMLDARAARCAQIERVCTRRHSSAEGATPCHVRPSGCGGGYMVTSPLPSLLSTACFQGRFSPDSGHKQAAAQRELRYIGMRCMPHLLQSKHEHLIRERETAAAQRATRNIGRRTVGRGTDRLPPTRQSRQGQPSIRFRIVGFVLVKSLTTAELGIWIALPALATEIEQQAMIIDGRPAATGGRHGRCLCPVVRRWIIDVVVGDVVDLPPCASADDMDFAVDDATPR